VLVHAVPYHYLRVLVMLSRTITFGFWSCCPVPSPSGLGHAVSYHYLRVLVMLSRTIAFGSCCPVPLPLGFGHAVPYHHLRVLVMLSRTITFVSWCMLFEPPLLAAWFMLFNFGCCHVYATATPAAPSTQQPSIGLSFPHHPWAERYAKFEQMGIIR
jgi:hypothetical protein